MMKIWIDENKPAPEGYVWEKDARGAITVMQQANLSIGRLLRNAQAGKCVYDKNEAAKYQVIEVNVSEDFRQTPDGHMFDIYLKELDREDLRVVQAH